jgi:hypothetical protein
LLQLPALSLAGSRPDFPLFVTRRPIRGGLQNNVHLKINCYYRQGKLRTKVDVDAIRSIEKWPGIFLIHLGNLLWIFGAAIYIYRSQSEFHIKLYVVKCPSSAAALFFSLPALAPFACVSLLWRLEISNLTWLEVPRSLGHSSFHLFIH